MNRPADGADAVGSVGEVGSCDRRTISMHVCSNRKGVVVLHDRDVGVRLGRRMDDLVESSDNRVVRGHRRLGSDRVVKPDVQRRRDVGGRDQLVECNLEPFFDEHAGKHAMCQAAQAAQRLTYSMFRTQQRRCGWRIGTGEGDLQVEGDADQALSRAVVQVAFDAPSFLVGCGDHTALGGSDVRKPRVGHRG